MKLFSSWLNYDKIKRKSTEQHKKMLKSIRNWTYYQRHRDEILKKRRERYRNTGQ